MKFIIFIFLLSNILSFQFVSAKEVNKYINIGISKKKSQELEEIKSKENGLSTLALNWKPEPQFGGFYFAQLNQIYEKNGLKLEIIPGGSGTPTVQMLAQGKIDFAIVSAEEILISNNKNPKKQIIALFATFQKNPQMIMTHAERGFKNISDIFNNDGFLAWQSGLSYSLYLKQKYPASKVKMVPYLGGLTQFQKEPKLSQQGFITSEPIAAEKLNLKVNTFLVADEGFNPYTTVLATRKEILRTQPELVTKMISATQQGWDGYIKNPTETNNLMQKLNPAMDIETFNKSAQSQNSLIETADGIGKMTEARWESLIQQMKDLGLIKGKIKAQEQFYNSTR